jgi:hypothetical protein
MKNKATAILTIEMLLITLLAMQVMPYSNASNSTITIYTDPALNNVRITYSPFGYGVQNFPLTSGGITTVSLPCTAVSYYIGVWNITVHQNGGTYIFNNWSGATSGNTNNIWLNTPNSCVAYTLIVHYNTYGVTTTSTSTSTTTTTNTLIQNIVSSQIVIALLIFFTSLLGAIVVTRTFFGLLTGLLLGAMAVTYVYQATSLAPTWLLPLVIVFMIVAMVLRGRTH